MQAEQVLTLVKDLAVGAVEVLRRVVGPHRPRTEAEHAAAAVTQRKGDARAEAVIDPPRLLA